VNLYGPGDRDDPETSHVIPALIRKCLDARQTGAPEIVCWGDGSPTREFLYVEDCAEAILLATDRYDGAAPASRAVSRRVERRASAFATSVSTGSVVR